MENTLKNIILISSILCTFNANAQIYHKVVTDTNGDLVRNDLTQNCVRSEYYKTNIDECAQQIGDLFTTVFFDFDSSKLSTAEKLRLNAIFNTLEGSRYDYKLLLAGYADDIGSKPYNKILSKKRADAVKSFLDKEGYKHVRIASEVGEGVSSINLHCEGLTRNAKIKCLAPKRRVDILIVPE
jgi:outer membrane protein OmpA-like peptidoglycan-associated protein